MRKYFLVIIISLSIIGCKKKTEPVDQFCSCVTNSGNNFYTVIEDSTLFYPMLLGTWYLKQSNSIHSSKAGPNCYCDTQYTATFLANKTLILNLPGFLHDTVNYSFLSDTSDLIFTGSGTFNIPNDTSQVGQIFYSRNYLSLNTQYSSNSNIVYPPTFYLTRN